MDHLFVCSRDHVAIIAKLADYIEKSILFLLVAGFHFQSCEICMAVAELPKSKSIMVN